MVQLPRNIVNRILDHVRSTPDVEVCGLIGAQDERVSSCYPVDNCADEPKRQFLMEPKGQIDVLREMREVAEEPYAIYHSHPGSPPTPSATDLDLANYPDLLYLIVSLDIQGVLEMRAFRLQDGLADEVDIEMVT